MALTPEDVVNKRFQPTKFREGYDQDEVDDFLDEVVVELRRLNQENEELRHRLVAGDPRGAEQHASSASQPNVLPEPVKAPVTAVPVAAIPAPLPTPVPVVEPVLAAAPVSAAEQEAIDNGNTNNLLQLARKLHEEHVRQGVEKRDALIAEGHATAARVVSEAEADQRTAMSALDGEKAALEQQKTTLEHQIDDLRTFEREYRAKLKSYIEGQLHELDTNEPATIDSSPVPVNNGSNDSANENVSFVGAPIAVGSNEGVQSPPATFQGFGGN